MKKRILIKQVDDAYNYGNAMLGMVFINALNNKLENSIEIITDIQKDEYIEYYKQNIGLTLKKDSWNESESKSKLWLFRIIAKIVSSIKYSYHLNEFDHIIYLGGDYFTQYYGWGNMLYKMCNLLFTKKKKLIMLGQTIGNFSPFFIFTARILFKNIQLYTRDEISNNYAVDVLKMKHVILSNDLAFASLPNQNNIESDTLLAKYNLENNKYITIVLSGLIEKYSTSRASFFKSWISILEELAKTRNEKIVILAHVVTTKTSSDLPTIFEISELIKSNSLLNKRVVIIDHLISPLEARTILGKGKFTISCRMHAAISTFEMLKPAISISYSIKFDGVIGKGLNLPELVINQQNKSIWDSDEMITQVLDKCAYVDANYTKLISKIKVATAEAKISSINQISNVIKFIENENTI